MNTSTKPQATGGMPGNEGQIDLAEKGRDADGKMISLNRRLFMQFMSFSNCDRDNLLTQVEQRQIQAVIYQDINDFDGLGVLAYCEDPAYLVDEVQDLIKSAWNDRMSQKHDLSMLGRTYSIGYENDLEDVLIRRPVNRVCDPTTPWAVWYPVRRSGQFERQSKEDQRKMLMEHGGIGHAYGKAGYATDIRLAGHGLNMEDHDFIVGLLGKELYPLSALVQHMRRTRQTSEFIQSLGPFFIGKAIWQPNSTEVSR